MTRHAGFLKAFFGTCCGRDVFYTLRSHSWARTLWHLLLLSCITGFITGYFVHGRNKGLIDAAAAAFSQHFGEEIYVSKRVSNWNWIAPVKDPLRAREMSLPGGGRFYYTGNIRKVPDSLKSVSGTVVIWSPISLAVSVPGSAGAVNCMVIDTLTGKVSQYAGTMNSMAEIFKKAPEKLPLPVKEMKKEKVSEFFVAISALFSIFTTLSTVIWNFFLTLLYTAIFMGMYRLLNGPSGRLRFLTLSEMWKCGIYAAFPVMAIASVFPALELPLISYETVFMIGLLIYWMAVTAKLERTPADDEVNDAN